jgi:hypothetical protein
MIDSLDEVTLASMESQRSFDVDDELGAALCRALECPITHIGEARSIPFEDTLSESSLTRGAREPAQDARAPLDRAMDLAFDPNDHCVQDRFNVESALRYIPLGFIPPRETRAVARAWLDAAAVLREHGVVATFTTLVACVAALEGFPGEHARRLLAQAKAAGALDGEPSKG